MYLGASEETTSLWIIEIDPEAFRHHVWKHMHGRTDTASDPGARKQRSKFWSPFAPETWGAEPGTFLLMSYIYLACSGERLCERAAYIAGRYQA